MVRPIVAVVLGYLVFGISAFALFQLTGVNPHAPAGTPFMVFTIAYGVAFAFAAGYVTAWIARRDVLWPVIAVASLVAVIAAGSMAATRGRGAVWTQVATLVLMAPAVVLGGALRLRRQR